MEEQPTPATEEAHVAFLSSLSGSYQTMREDIYAANKPLLWVAEGNRPDLAGKPSLEIVDTCIEALSRSELFICLLIGDGQGLSEGGTLIEVGDVEAQVSYFEIEVFAAAARGLPIVFLETEGFSPGERLAEWLKILERSAVPLDWEKGCKILDLAVRVKTLIDRRAAFIAAQASQAQGAAQRLLMDLVTVRGKVEAVRRGGSDMLWSNRNRFERAYSDDEVLQRATALLDVVKAQSDPNRKMSRLYFVFRELFARPYDVTESAELLKCWNDALGQWWGASSWYGLHNHLSMGVITTLGTQAVVRARLAKTEAAGAMAPEYLHPPDGPLASAYYSLGKLLVGPQRRAVFQASLALTARVIQERGESDPSIYAVRGCVQFFLKQPVRGLASFYKLLRLARHHGNSIFLTAEAHSYLGRAFMEFHCAPLARSHLKESVAAWTAHVQESDKDYAFLVKALKNLAAFHESRGELDGVLETATKARKLAVEHGVYDQARQLDELLSRIKERHR